MSQSLPPPANVVLKSVRAPSSPDDGQRVLIDRLWPRGVSKQKAQLTEWCKEVAPSAELRRGFHHGSLTWEEFVQRYRAELAEPPASQGVVHLRALAQAGRLTLLYGTHNGDVRSNAPVLRDVLLGRPTT